MIDIDADSATRAHSHTAPTATTAEPSSVVDPEHPWLGLASFSENTRAYFYGREEEVAELARRVQRKLLTVLFGQSGLGKTSILRAGLVPRLRDQGYCPIYLRIDYGPDAPPASRQIKDAVLRETAAAGVWSQAGIADIEESLWEFLHHRDDVLRDAAGRLLTPLLIFDQFEEIFTLAQSDDRGRQRAAEFLEGLAELVENRPPAALEARLDEDDSIALRYDFARNDYRVLITLREDYLAHLESLKAAMPGITQNRMRLAPMTGQQALAAVLRPGGKLVSDEVAEAVVRFVAGGAELAHAQVEPSLLSLICRELNDKRVAAGRDVISLDLLAGSHASILADFYERTLADQPAGVRQAIEDILLTSSGYRENVAEERVLEALTARGARSDGGPDARSVLALLVNRRLLRIEDRLDVRRVELTHDVLCGVVGQSRALRQERDRQAAAERELASQREREIATHRALVRARRTVAVCVVLTVVAVAGSVTGYISMRRAQHTEAIADRSRGEAEALMRYLLDDFYDELLPVGRLDMLASLTGRTLAYYAGLPEGSRTSATNANWARAMMLNGDIGLRQGNSNLAWERAATARALLQPLIDSGTATDTQKLSFAQILLLQANVLISRTNFDGARPLLVQSIALMAPQATRVGAAIPARLAYANVLNRLGWLQLRSLDGASAQQTLRAAQAVLGTPAERAASIPMTVEYASAGQWLHELARYQVKDYRGAEQLAQQLLADLAEVLRQRPNHSQARRIRDGITFLRGYYAIEQRAPGRAVAIFDKAIAAQQANLQVDPTSQNANDGLAIYLGREGSALIRLGRVDEATAMLERQWQLYRKRTPTAYQTANLIGDAYHFAEHYAETGDSARLSAMLAQITLWEAMRARDATPERGNVGKLSVEVRRLALQQAAGDPAATLQRAETLINEGLAISAATKDSYVRQLAASALADASLVAARLAYAAGDLARAETHGRRAVENARMANFAGIYMSELTVEHALSLARLGRRDEARAELAPELAVLRESMAAGSDDQFLRLDLAKALYVVAQCQPGAGQAELKQARALLASMATPLQRYRSVQLWRERIDAALAGKPA